FPFIPLVPITIVTIVIALYTVMVVVVSGSAYGYRREQGGTQHKCTQVTMHSSSIVLPANELPRTNLSGIARSAFGINDSGKASNRSGIAGRCNIIVEIRERHSREVTRPNPAVALFLY